jgi:thiosulfate/3-mercaptopyruvate sulfurtransferase
MLKLARQYVSLEELMAEYAAPELLVSTEWLAEHLNDPNVRVIEMMQKPEPFAEGHIPGAVVSPDWQIKGSENTKLVAPPEEAKAWFESVGIGDDTVVVGYDRMHNRDAARLWWVMSFYGHTNVKVLNGGWTKWNNEGRPVEAGESVAPASDVTFTPGDADHSIVSTVDTLKAAIGDAGHAIWDLRSADEHSGAEPRGNARAGHVPGAVNLEWVNLVNEDDTFKSADELTTLLAGIGITPEKTVHTY